jgi:hypothetical protein
MPGRSSDAWSIKRDDKKYCHAQFPEIQQISAVLIPFRSQWSWLPALSVLGKSLGAAWNYGSPSNDAISGI